VLRRVARAQGKEGELDFAMFDEGSWCKLFSAFFFLPFIPLTLSEVEERSRTNFDALQK
jgi:hypothetical protein